MTANLSKYHILIDGEGYILDRGAKAVHAYQKKRAPSWVSKVGSGDTSYRDATFWQYWAQINWRNGAKQEKWGDGGKYWKSENIDTTQMEQITLSKSLVSAGQVEAGATITCQAAWRTSQNWWNASYGYRQQLTITAPASLTIPANYPIKVAIDTAALQTASKVRSDRKDWRIVYWNGSSWIDLVRDYVDTTATFFSTQTTIAPGTTNSNYYAYYGFATESTTKQPSTDAEWNGLYFPKVDDGNVLSLWHMKEGSGNSIVDTDSTNDQALNTGTAAWTTAGQMGRALAMSSDQKWKCADAAELSVGEFTIQWRMKADSLTDHTMFFSESTEANGTQFAIMPKSDGKMRMIKWVGSSDETQTTSVAIIPDTTNWYHYAVTYDGVQTAKYYRNNVLIATSTFTQSGIRGNIQSFLWIQGGDYNIQHVRYDNLVRTSFTGADVGLITATAGAETTTQPASSSFVLYVGTNTGKIYSWNGTTTWTLAYTATGAINCALVTSVGGTQKLLFGIGNLTSVTNADAKIISFDGSNWAVNKTFGSTPTESQVTALCEFSGKVYAGVGPQARVYETSDLSTYTLSKDIDFPQKPGYVYVLKEYNSQLIAAGGSPEFLSDKNYGGFAFVYNGTVWQSLYPFDHTVINTAEFYDAFLFLGTYHGQIYTYNTSYLDPLFSWKDDFDYLEQVKCMKYFDDKLYVGLYPQVNTSDANGNLWVFERHGLSLAGKISGITGITSLEQVNNTLMIGTGSNGYVYKLDSTQYTTTGWLQTSYFDANLPSINKLWDKIELNHKPLLGGQSITLSYRYKEEDAWVDIPASPVQAVGATTTVFPFPAATSSKKISIRITLTTTDQSKSPTLKEFVLRYTLIPVLKFQWNLRIKAKSPLKLADGTLETRTGEEIRTDLETALSDTTLHTFTDIDGSVYNVLFYDLDEGSWVINQEDSSGATIPVTLIQA